MKQLLLLPLIFVAYVHAETVGPKLPTDVAKFIERRDGCDHFRGEEPYDAERRKFLESNIRKLCIGTDRELSTLRRKYSKNPRVISRLSEYEQKIERNSKQ
jgi:hypothetical protein